MIGNDIVDLTFARLESNWQRRGFLEKQFTTNEQKLILTAKNSFILVWKFWSMKEAAYKIYVQQNDKRFFAPKKFDCLLKSDLEINISLSFPVKIFRIGVVSTSNFSSIDKKI